MRNEKRPDVCSVCRGLTYKDTINPEQTQSLKKLAEKQWANSITEVIRRYRARLPFGTVPENMN